MMLSMVLFVPKMSGEEAARSANCRLPELRVYRGTAQRMTCGEKAPRVSRWTVMRSAASAGSAIVAAKQAIWAQVDAWLTEEP